jgi:hypothetical protein
MSDPLIDAVRNSAQAQADSMDAPLCNPSGMKDECATAEQSFTIPQLQRLINGAPGAGSGNGRVSADAAQRLARFV